MGAEARTREEFPLLWPSFFPPSPQSETDACPGKQTLVSLSELETRGLLHGLLLNLDPLHI